MSDPKFEIPRLKLRDHTGIYATGRARILQILEAAYDIVMTTGYASLTLREIARACGIRVGAVSYYYKTKEDLIKDLLESALAPYQDFASVIENDTGKSAEQKLELMIKAILDDISSEKTTKFYPEIWALSNHDEYVSGLLELNYKHQRDILRRLIQQMNPALAEHEVDDLALYISMSLEGATIFIGFHRPQRARFAAISQIAIANLVGLVKQARPQMPMPGQTPAGKKLIGSSPRAAPTTARPATPRSRSTG